MKCGKCHADLPEIAKFCFICGAEVIRERICQNCGHKLEENARFCMMCGTPADSGCGLSASSCREAEKYNETLPILSKDEIYGFDDWWWIQTEVEPTSYVPFVRPSENRVDT